MRKRHLISLLFLVHFSIFAASPLVYSHASPEADIFMGTTGEEITSDGNFSIFLLEILCSNLDRQKGNEDEGGPAESHFLIKKKRAVIRANTIKKIISLNSIPSGIFVHFVSDSSVEPAPFYIDSPTGHIFLSVHSGLSPPPSA